MSMMRRGPLDRYPVEWVLRQASSHQVSGSIELHSEVPATFWLRDGRIYAAEPGAGHERAFSGDPSVWLDEHAARAQVVDVLSAALGGLEGWYYHDPLDHHPCPGGAWVWETAVLLLDARSRAHERQTLAAWTDRPVALAGTDATSVMMGGDAWAVVVALAATAPAHEVRARLGWSPDRVLAALSELEEIGVLDGPVHWQADLHRERRAPAMAPSAAPAPPPSSPAAAAALPLRPTAPPPPRSGGTGTAASGVASSTGAAPAPMPPPLTPPPGVPAATGNGRHTGPLAPPPVLPEGGRRRRRSGRRA